MFSHEASLKNCSCAIAIFAYFIFSKILKIELSPRREPNFARFENCFGPFFRVPKILKIAVLRACQHNFSNVHALNSKDCSFYVFMKNTVFPMFFTSFGAARKAPRDPPLGASMSPSCLGELLGCPIDQKSTPT